MTLTAWRVFKPKHKATAFTGEGARLYGGRWNSKGTAVVYTAQSISLAALEMLVHLDAQQVLETYRVARVTFEARLVEEVPNAKLPAHWRADPPPTKVRRLGDDWVKSQRSAVLRVPSTIVITEYN